MTRLLVWCLLRDQYSHVKPVEQAMASEADFYYDSGWDPGTVVARRPDVVVCVNDLHYDIARCIDAVRAAGIPSLVVQDGILEWRCQYENPSFGAGGGPPQHQPVLADKIACIGNQSARQIAMWGNAAKVEVTGMPRLDFLLTRVIRPAGHPGRRVLVMTAKKPGFTPEQTEVTLQSLKDIAAWSQEHREVDFIWRITKGLHNEIGVENRFAAADSAELADAIDQVDAVITTPSTAILEGWLMGRPVAALDYHNVPRFVPTAWTISAPEHIEPTIRELLAPPTPRSRYQDECRRDCLAADAPAAPRVAELIRRMAAAAKASREAGQALEPRPNLLGHDPWAGLPWRPDLQALYGGQGAFGVASLDESSALLARAYAEIERLQRELSGRYLSYWLGKAIQRMRKSLRHGTLRSER